MKNQRQQEARELFFNTNLSKTEIAERLSVSRRTIYQWSVDGDWDKLRQSARHMPAILAEKVSYILGHFADSLLSAESSEIIISKTDVDMLHKLTNILHKLRKGSTVAENMETFNYLLERIDRQDPALAQQVAPYTEGYIRDRRGKDESSFLLHGFDETGHLPYSEQEHQEFLLDQMEAAAILAEHQAKQQPATSAQPSAPKPTQTNTQSPSTGATSAKAVPSAAVASGTAAQSTKPRPVHTPLHYSNAPQKQTHMPAVAA